MANGNNSRQNRDPYINERPSQRNSFDSYFSDDHFVDDFFEDKKPKSQPKQDPNWYMSSELSDSRSEALRSRSNPTNQNYNNRSSANPPLSRQARRTAQNNSQNTAQKRPSSQPVVRVVSRPNGQVQGQYRQPIQQGQSRPSGQPQRRTRPNPNGQPANGNYNQGPNRPNGPSRPNPNIPNHDGLQSARLKKSIHRPGWIARILSILAIVAIVWLIYQLVRINILPMHLLMIVCGLVVILGGVLVGCWLFKTRRPFARYAMGFLTCVFGLVCAFGGFMLKDTDKMFEQVTNLTNKQVNSVTVYAMKESNIEKPNQLTADKKLGVTPSVDQIGTTGMLDQLHDDGANFQEVVYDDVYSLVDALYAHEVDAIAFPEIQHAALYEIANDDNKYNALTTFTNVVDSYLYYTDRDPASINRSDPVRNIMSDPFVVLVSGNDSYGSISQESRSDVNMLVVVNPKTAQVLMVSIPRDSYMPVSCNKNATACSGVAGYNDKLTHTGLYGIGTTESTIEDYFGIDINYYVRVNFSSLINIVDAIGGIDIYVEPGLEVETFYANGTEGVQAGWNHLEGERALAFARERHAYLDGDLQRTKNQQIVLRAMLKQLLSPSMVINYPDVMQPLSTAFDTNMSENEIKSLLTLELSKFPNWNFQSYAILGEPSTQFSASAMQDLSVMMLYDEYVAEAKGLIQQVLGGGTVNLEDPNANVTPQVDPTTPSVDQPQQDPASQQEPVYGEDYIDPSLLEQGYQDPDAVDPNVQDPGYVDPNTVVPDDNSYLDPGFDEPVDGDQEVYY